MPVFTEEDLLSHQVEVLCGVGPINLDILRGGQNVFPAASSVSVCSATAFARLHWCRCEIEQRGGATGTQCNCSDTTHPLLSTYACYISASLHLSITVTLA